MKGYGPAHELLLTNPISEIDRARRKDRMWELRERAQGLVEYGLIIALVAVLAIAGLIIFGPAVSSLLSKLGGSA